MDSRAEFKIENTEVFGLNKSFIASGNAMRIKMDDNLNEASDKDIKRSIMLGRTNSGEGHDNFLNGVIVQFDIYAPLYMWKQIQRYHFLDFISSQSTMHRLTKFNIKECCVSKVDNKILERYQEILDEYNNQEKALKEFTEGENKVEALKIHKDVWKILVASLPSGFVLGATMTTNYRQLKTMYNQRKNHKLSEWHEFCDWCDLLPYFNELTGCSQKEDLEVTSIC